MIPITRNKGILTLGGVSNRNYELVSIKHNLHPTEENNISSSKFSYNAEIERYLQNMRNYSITTKDWEYQKLFYRPDTYSELFSHQVLAKIANFDKNTNIATLGPVGKTCGLGQSEHYY